MKRFLSIFIIVIFFTSCTSKDSVEPNFQTSLEPKTDEILLLVDHKNKNARVEKTYKNIKEINDEAFMYGKSFLEVLNVGDAYIASLPNQFDSDQIESLRPFYNEIYYFDNNNFKKFDPQNSIDKEVHSNLEYCLLKAEQSYKNNIARNSILQGFRAVNEAENLKELFILSSNFYINEDFESYKETDIANLYLYYPKINTEITEIQHKNFDVAYMVKYRNPNKNIDQFSFVGYNKLKTPISMYDLDDSLYDSVINNSLTNLESKYTGKIFIIEIEVNMIEELDLMNIFDDNSFMELIQNIEIKN